MKPQKAKDPTEIRKMAEQMFNAISPRYDFLNHILSLGIDRRWRRKLIQRISPDTTTILDVATGTGDLAIAAAKSTHAHIMATDIAEKMMAYGIQKARNEGLQDRITFSKAAAESLPFGDHSFDTVMVAFGIRNFGDPVQGLKEFRRVLKPGGMLLVLEFSMPKNPLIKTLYRFYFGRILPWIGGRISKNHEAYRYLPESVDQFPYGEHFTSMMCQASFVKTTFTPMTGNIAMLYEGMTP